jgi:hypothetical protein
MKIRSPGSKSGFAALRGFLRGAMSRKGGFKPPPRFMALAKTLLHRAF